MKKNLLQLLLDKNLITEQCYKDVKASSFNSNFSEEQIILRDIKVDLNGLISIVENDFSIPYMDLESNNGNNGAFKLISKEIASRYSLIPFYYENNELHVAFSNPFDIKVIDELRFITNKKIKVFFALLSNILKAIENCYGKQIVDVAVEELKKEYMLEDKEKNEEMEGELFAENAPVIRITNSLLKQAVNSGASDIHLEPFKYFAILRMRVDGILNEINQIPSSVYKSLCARIKIMANIDIATKLIPQDGKITENIDGTDYDFRVSSLPTMYGEKLVIRVLYKLEKFINLDSLGFSFDKVQILKDILKLSHGMIVVAGPTGSGKSTTLYALLNEINSKSKNIITIEDPIEYNMPRINQVNVNIKAGLTFSTGLRSILRQDPDVIMLGEIRDEETAQIAVRASITGHLVLSTLHTNDAVTSISRLIDMGIPSYLVADSLVVVLAQRLIRKLCCHCKIEHEITHDEFQHLGFKTGDKIYSAVGCNKCNKTGYKGRTVVYELLKLDSVHKSIIARSGISDELWKYCNENKSSSFMESCRDSVLSGVTSIEEFVNATYSYNFK
ncbi:GspE/PulE family protein [Clostridium bowmanii]|uniref:GspE/PulE family protein n=1 Tax=Clostridium bowmanii TaxID=132925 RepID=UPI001C0E3512|nr:GspE/PulE family protein [Clostridium bowmanii]MBU3189138.1 GspE/PulE family protein [Clostridium bowmanii]MCA1073024.1 GspE/PulE family protein [Clostridium bowmanii]